MHSDSHICLPEHAHTQLTEGLRPVQCCSTWMDGRMATIHAHRVRYTPFTNMYSWATICRQPTHAASMQRTLPPCLGPAAEASSPQAVHSAGSVIHGCKNTAKHSTARQSTGAPSSSHTA